MKNKSTSWIIAILSIAFISINLRSPLTSVSPVVNEIIEALNLSTVQAGLITTIPLLTFAFLSIFMPRMAEKYGLERVLWLSMPIIIIGLALRITGGIEWLLLGSGIVGIAITIGNVLVPAFIKAHFPTKVGILTSVSLLGMNGASVFATGYSVKIGELTGMGWKGSIGFWIITAIIGFIFWIPQLKRRAISKNNEPAAGMKSLVKHRQSWYITMIMGLQSCLFYAFLAWLPTILQDWGMDKETSGWMFSYILLTQIPATMVAPILIDKMKNHVPIVIATSLTIVSSILVLVIFKTEMALLAMVLFGIGTGFAFSIVLMFFVLKTQTAARSAQLSGFSQSFGYLIAAATPPLFGFIYELSGDWVIPVLFMQVPIAIAYGVFGVLSARKGAIA